MRVVKFGPGVIAAAIVFDGGAATLFCMWRSGSDGAGNLLIFGSWVMVALRVISVALCAGGMRAPKLSPGVAIYHVVTEIIFIGALAWIGFFWLAGALALASLMILWARSLG